VSLPVTAGAPREPAPSTPWTTFHARIARELQSLRSGESLARLTTALAGARVDMNPHQIEAAAFALDCLPSGGCVLADEVGLGKTIEAGLVLAQLAAEGRHRQLILCPATLRAQWQTELQEKFQLPARIVPFDTDLSERAFVEAPGPIICSIPYGAARAGELASVDWDLVVIDEAHRLRNAYRSTHKTGRALRQALRNRPKVLLTATPLQNDLLELFGLVSFLDERTLGTEPAFRLRYGGDSGLGDAQAADLKARLSPVMHRTLRRQVREYVRFTERRGIVEDFVPSPDEEALYERVSDYLRRPNALAVDAERRPLLLLVYRKLLASSSFAIAPTLRKLADSLEARSTFMPEEVGEYAEELEAWEPNGHGVVRRADVAQEVAELRAHAAFAETIAGNAKGEALVRALDRVFTVARAHRWPDKAVVFTESRRTQQYLLRLLSERGHAGAVSVLSGDAGTPEQRRALVDEFRDRTRVLLSTEAGAEGLNLQFCNVVVNYDLPWNPQRLEQRIGRCHRYGQTRDVMVINFLNRRNAADARLYELLEQKLHLFDGVFGASDEILGALDGGVDFERRVLDIYQSCRTPAEVDEAFALLQTDLEGRIDRRMTETRSLLVDRFDADVRNKLRLAGERVSQTLASRARPMPAVPDRGALQPPEPLRYLRLLPAALPAALSDLRGAEGWWFVYRFELGGPHPDERLAHLVLVKDGGRFRPLSLETAALLVDVPAEEESRRRPESIGVAAVQERALAEISRHFTQDLSRGSERALDRVREKLDRFAEDCLLPLEQKMARTRAVWEAARQALRLAPEAEVTSARAAAVRAEKEHRRALAALRSEEQTRVAERDELLAKAAERHRVRETRSLVASAYWWL
jgi:ERCC4-related helicase